ncbi:MAG TPA: hypothetical protein VKZ56_03050 [Membranihabitans sp.]|nr:hypothetical protein [Membranihabitans sp.]
MNLRPYYIPETFWIDWSDASGKIANYEEENVDIAGVTSRLSDEVSGHFATQIPVKPACRYRQNFYV